MPFTLSHPSIVLPFARLLNRWRVLSATVIGAMVPDFGMFLPWRMERYETHSRVALFTFCLPVGLIAYWTFQYLIKTPVLEVLPNGAYSRSRARAATADITSVRQWVSSVSAIFVGAVSHLVWDAFTHENARGVRMFPWIDEPIAEFGSHRIMGVRFLQDVSSLIGLAVVVGFVCYALRPEPSHPKPQRALSARERHAWGLAYAATAVILAAIGFFWARIGDPYRHFLGMIINGAAIAAVRGLGASLLIVSAALLLHLRTSSLKRAG